MIWIAAVAMMAAFAFLNVVLFNRLVYQVNERLPKERQFSTFGWPLKKLRSLHREYHRLFPGGNLAVRVWTMMVLWIASILLVALASRFM